MLNSPILLDIYNKHATFNLATSVSGTDFRGITSPRRLSDNCSRKIQILTMATALTPLSLQQPGTPPPAFLQCYLSLSSLCSPPQPSRPAPPPLPVYNPHKPAPKTPLSPAPSPAFPSLPINAAPKPLAALFSPRNSGQPTPASKHLTTSSFPPRRGHSTASGLISATVPGRNTAISRGSTIRIRSLIPRRGRPMGCLCRRGQEQGWMS